MFDDDGVAIIGAGVGGLTLAAALAQRHIPVRVFEQQPQLSQLGAGLQLSPNGARALVSLGLSAALAAIAEPLSGIEFRSWRGPAVATSSLRHRRDCETNPAQLAVSRAALLSLLLTPIPDGVVRFNQQVRTIRPSHGGVELRCANGERVTAAVAIAADGVHSRIRRAIVGRHPKFSGFVAVRARIPAVETAATVQLWLGPGAHLLSYPVRADSGARWLNLVAIAEAAAESSVAAVLTRFAHWAPAARRLLAAAAQHALCAKTWPLYHDQAVSQLNYGPVALLGDAAHPMLPTLSQGANQAIEDAVELAAQLAQARGAGWPQALAHYSTRRTARVAAIQAAAQAALISSHLVDGPAQQQRDAYLVRADYLAEKSWIYDFSREISGSG